MSKASLRLLLIPVGIVLAVVLLCLGVVQASKRTSGLRADSARGVAPDLGPVAFVGRDNCIQCHQDEYDDWHGSHHDQAMDHANPQTVLGDFDDSTFDYFGVQSRFFKKQVAGQTEFWVHTEGPDGQMQDYRIDFVFGVEPLQQYLIEFPGGRYQCLPIAWDTRPQAVGGQRWFHLYDGEKISHDDPLFWTGPLQNWNFMCGQCHSTNYTLGYDADTDAFNTTYNEIDVSCEACHGPGSRHEVWAGLGRQRGLGEDIGLLTDLKALQDNDAQINTCIVCHSRRSLLADGYQHGASIENHFVPEILRESLYHPDGAIQDEVYVYGSFVQSEMYHHQNVKCSDCHNPHSLKLRHDDNMLCVRCHIPNANNPDGYDTPKHHFHEVGTEGASCVECHMPETTYMVVDPRRDHSMRVPRPDLSVEVGGPNACTKCHTDQSDQWAADAVTKWYGPSRASNLGVPNHARVFAAARENKPSAEADLNTIANDEKRPVIVRATALHELRRYGGQASTDTVLKMLKAESFWLRHYAVMAVARLAPERQAIELGPMLSDPALAVRVEAARVLSEGAQNVLADSLRPVYEKAIAEYEQSQLLVANQAGGRLNLGVLYTNQGKPDEAKAQYEIALKKDPTFLPAMVNLATLENQAGNNPAAESLLRRAVEQQPDFAEGWYSLGLLVAETKGVAEAVDYLGKAAELAPQNLGMARNYAVALHQAARLPEALREYQRAVTIAPNDLQALQYLASFYLQIGYPEHALPLVQRLRLLSPQDQDLLRFETQVQAMLQQKQRANPGG